MQDWMFWLGQLVIPITGASAIALSQSSKDKTRRWACILGLIGQPFWFYSTWTSGNYGIFLACFLYLLAWLKGFHQHWVIPYFKRIEK